MARHDSLKNELVFNRCFVLGGKELSENDWLELFSPFGKVTNVHMTLERNTGRNKGITYISFSKTSECCRAVEQMNGKFVRDLEKPIKVIVAGDRKATTKAGVDETNMLKRLFVMFPKTQSEDDLREYFEQFGEVDNVRVIRSKKTNSPRNLAYVKFYNQSGSARAFEECDRDYRPIFADVKGVDEADREDRSRGESRSSGQSYSDRGGQFDDRRGSGGERNMSGFSDRSYSSMSGMGRRDRYDSGPRGRGYDDYDDRRSGRGRYDFDERRGDCTPRYSDNMLGDSPMDLIRNSRLSDVGLHSKILEICVTGRVSEGNVKRLCDLIPGLVDYRCDASSGIAYVEYSSPACAAYAFDKLSGFEYPVECPLTVKVHNMGVANDPLSETAMNLNQSLQRLDQNMLQGKGVQALVESISKATAVLQQAGLGGSLGAAGNVEQGSNGQIVGPDEEVVPWCNIHLPLKKPFAPRDAPMEARLFIVSESAFANRYLEDAFSRFGNLISAFFMPGKGFGFAKFTKKESAEEAIRVMHGQQICNHRIKVMEAEPPRTPGHDGESAPKRMRTEEDE